MPGNPVRRPSKKSSRKKSSSFKKTPLTRCKFLPSTRSSGPTPMLRSLNFVVHVETTNTSPQRGMLLNRFEEPDSEMVSLNAGPLERFDDALNEHIELKRDELKQPGFIGSELPLDSIWKTRDGRTVAETRRTFKTRKGFFTVSEVVKAVEEFERVDRPKSKWNGEKH